MTVRRKHWPQSLKTSLTTLHSCRLLELWCQNCRATWTYWSILHWKFSHKAIQTNTVKLDWLEAMLRAIKQEANGLWWQVVEITSKLTQMAGAGGPLWDWAGWKEGVGGMPLILSTWTCRNASLYWETVCSNKDSLLTLQEHNQRECWSPFQLESQATLTVKAILKKAIALPFEYYGQS